MTNIDKEIYNRNPLFRIEDIDFNSESVISLQNKIKDLIDEIASYKPLYSTRKKIEQDPSFAIEQMKKVAIWSIQKHLGRHNG